MGNDAIKVHGPRDGSAQVSPEKPDRPSGLNTQSLVPPGGDDKANLGPYVPSAKKPSLSHDSSVRKPRMAPSPNYEIQNVARISAPELAGHPSLDGRYFAYTTLGSHSLAIVDLQKVPAQTRVSSQLGEDPSFSWDSLVNFNEVISLKDLDAWVFKGGQGKIPSQKTRLPGYANPNSRFMVEGTATLDDAPGHNSAEALFDILPLSPNGSVRIIPFDEAGRKVGQHIERPAPNAFNFSQEHDGPRIVARISRDDPQQGVVPDGYVVYSVDADDNYSLKKVIDIKGLTGSKAAIMDNLIAFAQQPKLGDHKRFGFASGDDPKFKALCKSKSADIFVYDMSTNQVHRVTSMGPGNAAWFPSFYRGMHGQPALMYMTYTNEVDAQGRPARTYHIQRATLKPSGGPSERERVIPGEVNVDRWTTETATRFVSAVGAYLAANPQVLTKHASMHVGQGNANKPDPEMLLKHRQGLRHFEEWLGKSAYRDLLVGTPPKLPAWRPNQPVPKEFLKLPMFVNGKKEEDYQHRNPVVRTPTWLAESLGSEPYPMADPVFGHNTLKSFRTPQELSLALTSSGQYGTGYHGAAHSQVGGVFGTKDSARTVLFWVFHRHLDNILDAWFGTENGQKWLASPAGKEWSKTSEAPTPQHSR